MHIGTPECRDQISRSPIPGCWSQVAGHRSRAAGRCISPLQCALTQKRVCNSFAICTYKSLDLKFPGMNTYKKHRGWGPLRSLQTLDLVHIFHCERRTSHKPLDLKARPMNSYKEYQRAVPSCLPWALPSGSQRRVSRPAQTSITTGERLLGYHSALRSSQKGRPPT